MRSDSDGYRRDHLRALVQRVEVGAKEVRIMDRKACSRARSSPHLMGVAGLPNMPAGAQLRLIGGRGT
jgi:hypothetical protein